MTIARKCIFIKDIQLSRIKEIFISEEKFISISASISLYCSLNNFKDTCVQKL